MCNSAQNYYFTQERKGIYSEKVSREKFCFLSDYEEIYKSRSLVTPPTNNSDQLLNLFTTH
jgi:hypothetical protein